MKKQLRGTTAKRKRAVKVKDDKCAGESVNFSEFDEYSLVISDSPVIEYNKPSRKELIETSTPVAKRTRGKENTFDRIRNSDLSNIETIEASPAPDSSYSVCTPASSLPNSISISLSTPSILISPLALYDELSDSSSKNESRGTSNSSPVIQTPENAVVHLEKLRESFILKHVSGRRKTIRTSKANPQSRIPEETDSRTPEDIVRVTLNRLTNSLIDAHSSGKKSHSSRLNEEPNNSQSLFDSPYVPYILTRNNDQNFLTSAEHSKEKNSSLDTCSGEEMEDDDDDDDDDDNDVSVEVGNLSAINEDEEDYSENSGDDDDVDDSEDEEIYELQESLKDLQVSDKSARPSEETLYMLNPDYSGEEKETSDNSEHGESEDSNQISGSRDLFSTYGGNSKISLRSARNISSKSDYFTATSANVSEECDFDTASDGEDEEEEDDDGSSGDDGEKVAEEEDNIVSVYTYIKYMLLYLYICYKIINEEQL